MNLQELQPGDMVFAATDIFNDGSIPGLAEGAPIAPIGARGVLINTGHLEEQPEKELYLVRFENSANELGPPVGCWPHELSAQPLIST